MDAITMRSTSSLINALTKAYPQFTFKAADDFSWNAPRATITFSAAVANVNLLVLHELGHAVLGHTTYHRDIELLTMETMAWETAKQLSQSYDVAYSDDIAQDHLDTYREWLHARSTCPQCQATGYQRAEKEYCCPACSHEWRVNEAKLCGLRRYSKKTPQ